MSLFQLRRGSGSGATKRSARVASVFACAIAGSLLHTDPAFAQITSGPVIYGGASASTAGITLSSWGSGTIQENTQVFLDGSTSLKITTQGWYQGGVITLSSSVDVGAYVTNSNAYLQLGILAPPTEGTGFNGFPPTNNNPPPGYGASSQGYSGSFGSSSGIAPRRFHKALPLSNLRVVLVTDSGKQVETRLDLKYAVADRQWKIVGIPMEAIRGLTADDAKIKSVRVFGDSPVAIYLGRIAVAIDPTPITIDPIDELVVPRYDRNIYTAVVNAGITPVDVSWNFDGIPDEALGRSVVHAFRKAGDHDVTVTVRDVYGLKKPVTIHFNVHVTS